MQIDWIGRSTTHSPVPTDLAIGRIITASSGYMYSFKHSASVQLNDRQQM